MTIETGKCECGWEFPPRIRLFIVGHGQPLDKRLESQIGLMIGMIACPRCSPNVAGKMVQYTMTLVPHESGEWWQWDYKKL